MKLLTSVLLGALISSCTPLPMAPLSEPADYEGLVGRVTMDTDSSGSIFMSEMTFTSRGTGAHEGYIHVGRTSNDPSRVETTVFVQRADTLEEASLAAIKPGQRVKIWTTGVELRSLPPQYYGRQIVITESP